MAGILDIPAPASNVAAEVDSLFVFILVIGMFFFVVTQGALIYFALKYRRKKGAPPAETPYITGNTVLEGVWLLIPTVLVFAIFAYGYVVFMKIQEPIPDAYEINVTARQWLWEFKYPGGRSAVNELRVPVGAPVHLVMGSEDVIHSLFIPDFRVKQDVLPGRYTHLWLEPTRTGEFQIFCAEYCGAGHSAMNARLMVMEADAFHEWEEAKEEGVAGEGAAGEGAPLAERGEHLVERSGCLACHSVDGTAKVGPTFKGLFGRKVALADGNTLVADEDYIRESVVDPAAKLVKGYPNVMPTFKTAFKPDELTAVIAYLKTLSGHAPDKAAEGD